MRHNKVRDLEAELMVEVCHDVKTEPELIPLENNSLGVNSATGERARPDVSGVGVWGGYERTFLDIIITHPNCPTYANMPADQLYQLMENQKKGKI